MSSSSYLDWMKPRQAKLPDVTPRVTGIPKLRKSLLGLPGERNLEQYQQHVCSRLLAFLDQVSRTVNHENKDDAFGIIHPTFQGLVDRLDKHPRHSFRLFSSNKISRLWDNPTARKARPQGVEKVVLEWADKTKCNTYNKFLREKGIMEKSLSTKYSTRAGES